MPLRDAESAQRLATIVEAIVDLVEGISGPTGAERTYPEGSITLRSHRLLAARKELQMRRVREGLMPEEIFSDVAWEVLLEVYISDLEGGRISISSIGIEGQIPQSTIIRWVQALVARDLLQRRPDPMDKRRVWINATAKCIRAMDAYFARKGMILESLQAQKTMRARRGRKHDAVSDLVGMPEYQNLLLARAAASDPAMTDLAWRCDQAEATDAGSLIA